MRLTAPIAVLGLILLLLEVRVTLGMSHSLCLNLTLGAEPSPGKPWYEAQGSVDGKSFLKSNSDSIKATPLGLLGMKIKDTKGWYNLTKSIGEIVEDLRMILHDTYLTKSQSIDVSDLKSKVCCQRDAETPIASSVEFSVNGQKALMNTINMTWITVDFGAKGIREEWESNWDLSEHLRKVSTEDCNGWIKEFLPRWDYMVQSAASSKAKETIQHYPSSWLISWITPVMTILSYLAFF